MSRRTILTVLGFVVVVVAIALWETRWRDFEEGHLCAEQYARAKSAADSGVIDAHAPIRNRGSGEFTGPNLTCGELRRVGRVK